MITDLRSRFFEYQSGRSTRETLAGASGFSFHFETRTSSVPGPHRASSSSLQSHSHKMRALYFGLLLSCTELVNGFRDTSPLFFFSTSEYVIPKGVSCYVQLYLRSTLRSIPISSAQIASEASLNKAISQQLQKCPSEIYVIVSQPGVNAVDFEDPFSAPHLRQKLMKEDENIRSSLVVSEVVGGFDSANISTIIQHTCGASRLEVDASSKSANDLPTKEISPGCSESSY